MTTPRRIEVEPLSEQRWERIERSLLGRFEREAKAAVGTSGLGRGAGRGWWFAFAALLGVVAVLLFVTQQRPPQGAEPSRITTGAEASHLTLPGLSLDVEPQSAVVVGHETSQGRLIVIDRGSVVCDVAPRTPQAALVVQAGAARVRVLGTRFKVTRLGEAAEVRVEHGVVEVAFGGELRLVEAGQTWAPAPSPPPVTPVVSPSPSVELPPGPSIGRPEERAPIRSRRESGSPPKRAPLVAAPAQSPGPSRQALFERAAALERNDPAQAARLYREIEAGADSWGQHALYARGRLEATRGNHAEAKLVLSRYLARFPRGSNAEDARAVLKRLK